MKPQFINITAEDVAAWIVAETAALNVRGANIIVTTFSHAPDEARFIVQGPAAWPFGSSNFSEAVAKWRASIKTPALVAAEKRALAAKLLVEADALHPTA